MKQLAYARKLFGAEGVNRKQIALDVGYSSNVSNSIKTHIENKKGFHNAMSALAIDSNNIALSVMHEMKSRGFKDFSNKELTGALNAIGNAWSKFNTVPEQVKDSNRSDTNKLRTVILQQIENQTVTAPQDVAKEQTVIHDVAEEDPGF